MREMKLRLTFQQPITGGYSEDPWTRDSFELTFFDGDEALAREVARILAASPRAAKVELFEITESPVAI